MRIQEPAADLPLLMAALSSLRSRPVPGDWVGLGEIGLAGEVRPAAGGEERLIEAAKQGFKGPILPEAIQPRRGAQLGIELLAISRLIEASGHPCRARGQAHIPERPGRVPI